MDPSTHQEAQPRNSSQKLTQGKASFYLTRQCNKNDYKPLPLQLERGEFEAQVLELRQMIQAVFHKPFKGLQLKARQSWEPHGLDLHWVHKAYSTLLQEPYSSWRGSQLSPRTRKLLDQQDAFKFQERIENPQTKLSSSGQP